MLQNLKTQKTIFVSIAYPTIPTGRLCHYLICHMEGAMSQNIHGQGVRGGGIGKTGTRTV